VLFVALTMIFYWCFLLVREVNKKSFVDFVLMANSFEYLYKLYVHTRCYGAQALNESYIIKKKVI